MSGCTAGGLEIYLLATGAGGGYTIYSLNESARRAEERVQERKRQLRIQLAIDEATLAEIELKLSNTDLEEVTRISLEIRAAPLRAGIRATKFNLD